MSSRREIELMEIGLLYFPKTSRVLPISARILMDATRRAAILSNDMTSSSMMTRQNVPHCTTFFLCHNWARYKMVVAGTFY